MTAATWVASIIGAVIVSCVLLFVFAALMLASQADDEMGTDYAALIERERDFDATGYPNADLPAVMWKDQGHE